MIAQEDKAPSHACQYQNEVFSLFEIECLFWPGNSPDLNMIEPAWPWLKRATTKKGPPKTRKEARNDGFTNGKIYHKKIFKLLLKECHVIYVLFVI